MEFWNITYSNKRLVDELIKTKWESVPNMGWKWLAFHRTKLIVQYFHKPNTVCLLGFIVYDEICNQLNYLELLPEYREYGYGGFILNQLFEDNELEFLTIKKVLPSAQPIWERIFERQGFIIFEKKRNTRGRMEYKIGYWGGYFLHNLQPFLLL
jgi:hypothetical protein